MDWNLARTRGPESATALHTGQDIVKRVAYRGDSSTIAAGCLDGTVRLWDASTGQELAAPPSE